MPAVEAYAHGMQAVRAPAVAGSFYPADPSHLRETVARLLAGAQYGSPPKALIAPHAGYVYSGPVAASAFRRIEDAPVSRIVLLGPSHFAPLRGLALPGAAAMRTPLGDVPVEEARCRSTGSCSQRSAAACVRI